MGDVDDQDPIEQLAAEAAHESLADGIGSGCPDGDLKSDDHRSAVPELAAAGPAGKALESTFRRLLAMNAAAQYQAAPLGSTDATKAVEWATRMVDAARDIAAT